MNVGGDRVALVVVREVLEERAADALDRAAGDLALDDVGVDHRSAVLAHDVAQDRDEPGAHVDLAGAHVRGVHEDRPGIGRVAGARLEPGLQARRQGVRLEVGEAGDLGERHADRRRAPHARTAPGQLDVLGRRLQLVGGDGPEALDAGWSPPPRTAPAVIEPLRLPAAPAPNAVTAVSPWMVATSAMSTPSASAVSWTTVVSMLFPVEPPAM